MQQFNPGVIESLPDLPPRLSRRSSLPRLTTLCRLNTQPSLTSTLKNSSLQTNYSPRQYQEFKQRQWRRQLATPAPKSQKKLQRVQSCCCVDSRNKIAVAAVAQLRKKFNYKHGQIQKYFGKIRNIDLQAPGSKKLEKISSKQMKQRNLEFHLRQYLPSKTQSKLSLTQQQQQQQPGGLLTFDLARSRSSAISIKPVLSSFTPSKQLTTLGVIQI